MPSHTVTTQSVFESANCRQEKIAIPINAVRQPSRAERRATINVAIGQPFNPFNLFDGAIVPSEILRSGNLLPSEKLVFARLMQFAGGKGRAWPSLEVLAAEVALSAVQTRRCVKALEDKGLIRRLARSGRSNYFEFLWHPIYEDADTRSSAIALPQSSGIAPPQSQAIGPGRSPMSARRESIESSSSEEIQNEENHQPSTQKRENSPMLIDDDVAHRRKDLDDPEGELLLRLEERHGQSVNRHAILQCVIGDLKSFSDLKPFLEFEKKQTTAPDKLKNPAGHYRRVVTKFYEARAKRQDSDIRTQLRALEAKIGSTASVTKKLPSCSLSRCNGTGECWDEAGLVSACQCPVGQRLPPKVLAAFEEMNASRKAKEQAK